MVSLAIVCQSDGARGVGGCSAVYVDQTCIFSMSINMFRTYLVWRLYDTDFEIFCYIILLYNTNNVILSLTSCLCIYTTVISV